MILGQFSPYIFFRYSSISVGLVIIIIYWISQYYEHEKPFPNCWISKVAQHYPEYVFFRIGTISGSVLVILGWFTNHFYIKTVCRQHIFNVKSYHPQVILVLGIMSSFALMGSTAYIDTGKMNQNNHQKCAQAFFICVVVAQVLNTLLFLQLLKKKIVNKTLVWLKVGQLGLIILQLIYSSIPGEITIFGYSPINEKGIFLEWSLTYTVLLGFLIMSYDVQNFSFSYETIKSKEDNIEQIHTIDQYEN